MTFGKKNWYAGALIMISTFGSASNDDVEAIVYAKQAECFRLTGVSWIMQKIGPKQSSSNICNNALKVNYWRYQAVDQKYQAGHQADNKFRLTLSSPNFRDLASSATKISPSITDESLRPTKNISSTAISTVRKSGYITITPSED